MSRRLLIAIFAASSVLEVGVAAASFFAPGVVATALQLDDGPGVRRLAFFASWLMLFFAALCCVTTAQLARRNPNGELLAGIFGVVFLGMGVAFFLQFREMQLLVMDTMRGAAILLLLALRRGSRSSHAAART